MDQRKYNAVLVIGPAILLAIILLAATVGVAYINAANYGVRAEQEIQALWDDNQNVLGQYTLKMQEAAQVPEMYKNDFKEIVTAAMQGRYGADGSRATFQWIKENNLKFDSSMHAKLQTLIEAGRNEFQAKQTRLIDAKRVYQTSLGYVWRGFWLDMAGYPKIDLEKYRPVVAGDTRQVFEAGVQAPIKLR
jgi:Na+-transporting NADH:ubiquinone oxidoreductase subunit NqrC